MDPETSMTMTSTTSATGSTVPPSIAVTVTTASTTCPPSGRYSFWKTLALNWVIGLPPGLR